MISRPRRLFDILHLFAHLVDCHLEVEANRRQRAVLRLGAQRVRLAQEFLHQKVKFPTGRRAGANQVAGSGDMRAQAVKFLGHVAFHYDQREFLRNPGLVNTIGGLQNAVEMPTEIQSTTF